MGLTTYRDLTVWQKATDLVVCAYRLTSGFSEDERFGLTSQARRAAVSIPANIAEGYGRTHRGDYLRHLSVARGSLAELETHLVIAGRLGLVQREDTLETWGLAQEVGKMLNKLIESLKEKSQPPAQTLSPGP